jgi:hypothetical protein
VPASVSVGTDAAGEQRCFDEAMTYTRPLFELLSRRANEHMLAAIADEYTEGRLLLIGTTNLDVMQPVI